ncbi:MAG: DNA polymerase I, partial [uncultured Solirubrobacteraceae bacterium]
ARARRNPGPARRRGRPVAHVPRVLRAAHDDHGRAGPAGQRAARHDEPHPPGRRAAAPPRGGDVLGPRGRALPHGGLPRLPRRPPADAGRARRAMGAGPGVLRGARLAVPARRRPGGRRRPRLPRRRGDRGRRAGAPLHGRPRHVPVRLGLRRRPLPRQRPAGPGVRRRRRGPRAVRDRAGAGAGLHRPARRPVGRAARREGHRGEDGGRAPARPRRPRSAHRARRRSRRGHAQAPAPPAGRRAPRAGRRAALLPRHRHPAPRPGGAPARPADGRRGRRRRGARARDAAPRRAAGEAAGL